MTYAVEHFMDLENDALRKRLGRYLEKQYASEKASRLSQDIQCDPRTAQNILNCHWPNARNMRAIVRRFGRDVIEAVFAPEVEPTLARLTAEVRALEEKLERTRAHHRQVAGGVPGMAQDAAATTAAPSRRTA
jgi:hypothetical protein